MVRLAYAEVNALGVVILLLFFLNQKRSGSFSLDDRIFNGILLAGSGVLILDGALWLLDGVHRPGMHATLMALTTLCFALEPVLPCLWAMYCDLRVNGDETALRRKLPLYLSPLLINLAGLAVNAFQPFLFAVDGGNAYRRMPLFILFVALQLAYLLWAFLIVLGRYRRCVSPLDRRDCRYLMFFPVPPLVATALQIIFYGTLLIWPSIVISVVIVYLNVLNRQISTDALTGLNNLRKLNRYLEPLIESGEAEGTLFAVMIDADHFKGINDAFGHASGDRALVQIAAILRGVCDNRRCFLARLGGDEFVIACQDTDEETVREMLRGIDARVAAFNRSGAEPYRLSLSMGTARLSPPCVGTAEALLAEADRRMYENKTARKTAQANASGSEPPRDRRGSTA